MVSYLNFFWVRACLIQLLDFLIVAFVAESRKLSIDLKERVIDLNKSAKPLGAISKHLQVPRSTVPTTVTVLSTPQIGKQTQTTTCCWEETGQDGQESTKNYQRQTRQVCNELEAAGRQAAVSTVKWVLLQHELRGRHARKKSLLQTQHLKAQLKIAADHMDKEKNLEENSVVTWNKNVVVWSQWVAICLEQWMWGL